MRWKTHTVVAAMLICASSVIAQEFQVWEEMPDHNLVQPQIDGENADSTETPLHVDPYEGANEEPRVLTIQCINQDLRGLTRAIMTAAQSAEAEPPSREVIERWHMQTDTNRDGTLNNLEIDARFAGGEPLRGYFITHTGITFACER